jgi:glutathione S-transferase
MNMIKLWGRANSGNVQYVAWALAELGLSFERLDVGGAYGGTDTDEYGGMNPNRLVPTLQDGELTLWESAAIVRYLGARYGDGQFWPADPVARAPLDQWAEWIKTSFAQVLLYELFLQLVRTREADRNQAMIASATQRIKAFASMLDARLAGTTYLGGEDICFADIMVGTPLYRYFTLDLDRADTPNLAAYYERLQQRAAYREHVMVSYEALRAK